MPGLNRWECLPTLQQSTEEGEKGKLKHFQMKLLEKVRTRDRNRVHYFKNPGYQRLKVTNILLIDLLIKTAQQGSVTISTPTLLVSYPGLF